MRRVLFVVALAACGNKPPQGPLAPLPADETPPAADSGKPPKQDDPKPEPRPEPPPVKVASLDPIEVSIPAPQVTVKLVSPGTGKREVLRYNAKPGTKQQVEVAMDFYSKQAIDKSSEENAVPTVVIAGAAETTAVDNDGRATYTLTIDVADARDVKGAIPAAQFKKVLGSLPGLVIGGTVATNGTTSGVTMKLAKPDKTSKAALDLLKLTLPAWPVLPTEPIAVGAKWRSASSLRLRDMVDVTQTTDYELVKRNGSSWTIKGTTRVTGTDQSVQGGGTISAIDGTGKTEVTLAEGALYPSATSSLETKFKVTGDDPKETMDLMFRIGSAVTPK
jgi:hypothetical protein